MNFTACHRPFFLLFIAVFPHFFPQNSTFCGEWCDVLYHNPFHCTRVCLSTRFAPKQQKAPAAHLSM
ncbi:MAG: hypothetical protein IJ982_11335, partial [Fibrobacter sp.]|nr:hypothetical protein [Fibrobacter sp.]